MPKGGDKKHLKIQDLKPDDQNANRGTARGMSMLEQSLRVYGAGRSILLDKDNKIIAGNKTAETAADVFGSEATVRVVETDGDEIIAVRRTDLDMDENPAARELAVADNRVGQVNLEFDPDVLAALQDSGVDMSGLWLDHELDRMLRSTLEDADNFGDDFGGSDADTIASMNHVRMVQIYFVDDEQRAKFDKLVDALEPVFSTTNTTDTVWMALQTADDQIAKMKERQA